MYDAGKILAGLAVFVTVTTVPLWYNAASGSLGGPPALEKPVKATRCIEPVDYMRAWHMDLLNGWRDAVVRAGDDVYVASDGERRTMSLTRTCLDCHVDRAKFCDECHGYVGVKPYCWECHLTPAGAGDGQQ